MNRNIRSIMGVLGAVLVAAACSNSSSDAPPAPPPVVIDDSARGTLVQDPPPRIVALSAAEFQASLNASATGQELIAVSGVPACGVDVQYITYKTVGGAGEKVNATGALMVPTGSATACTGARPILLYAHGTSVEKSFNLARLDDAANPAYEEGVLLAAMYAAQGYIVVAPNYAGYDTSNLGYHPYLNADQQSKDMIDALAAARTALPHLINPVAASSKLFVAGYSQGGHVAMATHKALQALGTTVTASAPMSGPYALAAFGDAIFYGNVNLGSTLFAPLITTSYQKSYGSLYASASEYYEPAFANGIEALLPSNLPPTELFAGAKLPLTFLFNDVPPVTGDATLDAQLDAITPPTTPPELAPLFALGFGSGNLINNATRLAYLQDAIAYPDGLVPSAAGGLPAVAPAHPLRIRLKDNDLRNWAPSHPLLLCGGNADPTVFFSVNTLGMAGYLTAVAPGVATVLDIDSAASGVNDPFAAAKAGFLQAKTATAADAVTAGATDGGAAAVTQAYHGALVPPFCNAAARGFFSQF